MGAPFKAVGQVVALALGACTASAFANITTLGFSTEMYRSINQFESVPVGGTLSGSISFDLSSPVTNRSEIGVGMGSSRIALSDVVLNFNGATYLNTGGTKGWITFESDRCNLAFNGWSCSSYADTVALYAPMLAPGAMPDGFDFHLTFTGPSDMLLGVDPPSNTSFTATATSVSALMGINWWPYTYYGSTGRVTVTAVPEPDAASMLAVGLGVVVWSRRKGTASKPLMDS
ncbi:MAG: PEP-CTERM sorting domain-containing protein [Leptothrix sp. (in: b-proteobacteria)]